MADQAGVHLTQSASAFEVMPSRSLRRDGMLTDRYATRICGVLSCFVITGTLPGICHAQALARELNRRRIRVFDFTRFSEPFMPSVGNSERMAGENGLTMWVHPTHRCVSQGRPHPGILAERGTHPGLAHIFSAIETCTSFQPWHDKRSGKTFLKPGSGKCLHGFFSFIDPEPGVCHLRVPWTPFRLQNTARPNDPPKWITSVRL